MFWYTAELILILFFSLRPDSYIGSVETVTEKQWVYDDTTESMVQV